MNELLAQLAFCIENGKTDINAPFPADLKGKEGASELTVKALNEGVSANDILQHALMVGMKNIGERFSRGEVFVPNLLLAARAMNCAMVHLKPYFESGEANFKGILVLGTVKGDLHDIGKNLVKMVMEGDGWKVIDLGVDVGSEKFLEAVKQHPGCIIGLSALLTTTMTYMKNVVNVIKKFNEGTKIYIGGAPVSLNFSKEIGADGYFEDPHKFAQSLN